jgi:hypothetical protein
LNSFFSNFIQIFSGELANFSNTQKESSTSTGGDDKQKELDKDPSTVDDGEQRKSEKDPATIDDDKQKDPPAENGSKNEGEKLSEVNVVDEKAETETMKVESESDKEKIVDEEKIE